MAEYITKSHSHSYLPLSGGTMNGILYFAEGLGLQGSMGGGTDWWELKGTGTDDAGRCQLIIADNCDSDYFDLIFSHYDGTSVTALSACGTKINANVPLYGAVWNDYAEYRNQVDIIAPGYCVASQDNGQVYKTTTRLQACDGIVSDTFGFSIGETNECKTPLAVAGRVLAYYEGDRYDYHAGDTVGAGPEGKVVKMTREEIKEYPDRIVGIVSEIPEYEIWGTGNVLVNGRIWIKVK